MKKCYVTIHVWLHDMDHNMDLNYRRKIRPDICSFGAVWAVRAVGKNQVLPSASYVMLSINITGNET